MILILCFALVAAQKNRVLDLLIILVLIGIVVSLGFGLYYLVVDRGKTERTVVSLSFRVGLAVLLLIILGLAVMTDSTVYLLEFTKDRAIEEAHPHRFLSLKDWNDKLIK